MGKPMIGYLKKGKLGVEGDRGLAYDYILAQNGVFLEAQTPLMRARIRVGEAEVRGLEPLTERVELAHGPVPGYFLALALQKMRQDPNREVYLAITWHEDPAAGSGRGQYVMQQPEQEGSPGRVIYRPLPNTVVDFHSHGAMAAHFSGTDDRDDQGFRISVVVGRLHDRSAEYAMRLGVYGYHVRVSYPEVFSGDMPRDLAPAADRG